MGTIILYIIRSAIISVIITKILATHYFKIIDGYVDDMIEQTKDFVESMKHKNL